MTGQVRDRRSYRIVELCDWCESKHFRNPPELPGHACYSLNCECWCSAGAGQS